MQADQPCIPQNPQMVGNRRPGQMGASCNFRHPHPHGFMFQQSNKNLLPGFIPQCKKGALRFFEFFRQRLPFRFAWVHGPPFFQSFKCFNHYSIFSAFRRIGKENRDHCRNPTMPIIKKPLPALSFPHKPHWRNGRAGFLTEFLDFSPWDMVQPKQRLLPTVPEQSQKDRIS